MKTPTLEQIEDAVEKASRAAMIDGLEREHSRLGEILAAPKEPGTTAS